MYEHGADFSEPLADLTRVPQVLESVVEAMSELGYAPFTSTPTNYALNPNAQQLRDQLRATAAAAPIIIVYYTGHGVRPERKPYYLVTSAATPARLTDTAVAARDLRDLVLLENDRGEALSDEEQPTC